MERKRREMEQQRSGDGLPDGQSVCGHCRVGKKKDIPVPLTHCTCVCMPCTRMRWQCHLRSENDLDGTTLEAHARLIRSHSLKVAEIFGILPRKAVRTYNVDGSVADRIGLCKECGIVTGAIIAEQFRYCRDSL